MPLRRGTGSSTREDSPQHYHCAPCTPSPGFSLQETSVAGRAHRRKSRLRSPTGAHRRRQLRRPSDRLRGPSLPIHARSARTTLVDRRTHQSRRPAAAPRRHERPTARAQRDGEHPSRPPRHRSAFRQPRRTAAPTPLARALAPTESGVVIGEPRATRSRSSCPQRPVQPQGVRRLRESRRTRLPRPPSGHRSRIHQDHPLARTASRSQQWWTALSDEIRLCCCLTLCTSCAVGTPRSLPAADIGGRGNPRIRCPTTGTTDTAKCLRE